MISLKNYKLKKDFFIGFIIILFTLSLIIFSKANLEAAKSGLTLWFNSVVPSLFCFFVATELLSHTFVVSWLGKILNKLMKPLFNVPGEGAFALVMGIISGYPTGAKIICDFRKNNICTKEEGERLLAFTNNSGPLFIIGTVGISMFYDARTGFLLLLTHILACLTVGILFRFWKYNKHYSNTLISNKQISTDASINFSNFGEILGKSIMNSIHSLVLIGGFIVFFSVIISIIRSSGILNIISIFCSSIGIHSRFIEAMLLGIIEITNGIQMISTIPSSSISINIILCSFLLGFGGISVLFQVSSIVAKSDISIKPYILGKVLHGLLASLYTFIILKCTNLFNLDLNMSVNYSLVFPIIFGIFLLFILPIFTLFVGASIARPSNKSLP